MKIFPSLFSNKSNAQSMNDSGPEMFRIVKHGEGSIMNDDWSDPTRKIGGPRPGVAFCSIQLDYESLSYLTDFDWLSRRIVRSLPEAAWQDEILFTDTKARDNWRAINHIEGNDDGAFLTAAIWARTHGASLLIMGHTHSGSVEKPLPENHGPVEFLSPVMVTDYEVQPEDINNDKNDAKHYGFPEFYRITGEHRFAGIRIHRSRVIHFSGPTVSGDLSSREPDKLVGLSVLDPVYEAVRGYGLTWASIQNMTEQASIPIWTLKGLIQGLAKNKDQIRDRMQLQQEMLSTNRAVLLDSDHNESYKREAATFADVPQILQQVSLRVAAAGCIPAQELFGRIISGLGDTGEGESKKWEAQINSYRTRTLAPRVREILGPDVEWEFKPVSKPAPKDWATTVKEWWNMGQITDEELRKLTEEALTLPELSDEERAEIAALNKAATAAANEPDDDPDKDDEPDEDEDEDEDEDDESGKQAA